MVDILFWCIKNRP